MKNSEKIHLHLLEYDSPTDSNHIKDLGEVTFDEKGIAKVKFTIDEIKTELNKLNFERGNYEMFFAAEFKEGGVQFAEVSRKKRGGKDTVYPVKTVSHSELEKAKFTYIDSKKDITSVRFLKTNGKDAYEVIKYGEPIKVKVQTRNLNGTRLTGQMFVNLFANGLHKAQALETKEVKDETVEWDLNTAECKEKIAKSQTNRISFWQVEVTEEKSTGGETVQHPPKTARKKNGELDWQSLLTYQSLKLSDVGKTSELAKTNAPLIVGEPLEMKDSHEKGNCFCNREIKGEELNEMVIAMRKATNDEKGENFYKWNKDNLFTLGHEKFTNKSYDSFAQSLNKAFEKYNITSCIRKIHFLAQCYHETGGFMRSVEGSENDKFRYDPYRGRGFIHLTLEGNYKAFKKDSGYDVIGNIKLPSTNIEVAAMSSGWYWKYNDMGNINPYADKDDIFNVSRLVNNPSAKLPSSINGYSQRVNALNALKQIFKYPQICIVKNNSTNEISGKAPWMVYAAQEYETYKGQNENSDGLKDRITNHYHPSTSLGKEHHGKKTQWGSGVSRCASFVNWCFEQTNNFKNTNPSSGGSYNSLAYDWKSSNWENGEKCEKFYGAVAVLNFSHVGFVVGKTKNGKIVILGGNQDGNQDKSLPERICYTSVNESSILEYTKPKGYNISENEKELKIIDITAEDDYNSTR